MKSIDFEQMTLGVCYYPEHWDKTLWDDDLSRMEECGIKIVRIAEFAWNLFEPSQGDYHFELFDEFLELVKQHDIKVVFCTPTATPPAWLTEGYPEVLNARMDGTLMRHGMRRHYNYNSSVYNEFTKKIVTQLAKHYGEHECIIGWQIDNELNCETDEFYSECDHAAFRVFLNNKYETLNRLNEAWGTNFWSQEYTDWEQIHLTRPNGCGNTSNPHLALDEKRFFSDSCIKYCKLQHDILRSIISKHQFITTNGMFSHLDSHEMTDVALDFFTYDSYPNFAYSAEGKSNALGDVLKDRKWSYQLTKVRSVCPNFGIMEQQAGANGWVNRMMAASPRPGQMRLWTFQSVCHGADFVSYFRWRTCGYGTEIYWHGLNDYSNIPNRRIEELKQINSDLQKLEHLPKTKYKAEVALIRDYDNEWDGEFDKWHGPLTKHSEIEWFKAATFSHTPMDVLQMRDVTAVGDLSRYKMLIYPHAAILTQAVADRLTEYVKQGGILIMGARTGYKDEYGRCPMRPMPGFAENLCAVRVTDFTMLVKEHETPTVNIYGKNFKTPLFHDILSPNEGGEALGRFEGGYYGGEVAAVENNLGEGKTLYFGGVFTEQLAIEILKQNNLLSPCNDIIALPKECELAIRADNENEFLFILNYSGTAKKLKIKRELNNLLQDKLYTGIAEIEPYGVAIFRL